MGNPFEGAKVGDRFLVHVHENDSIGELEVIEPQLWPGSSTGTLFHGKWWDGELTSGKPISQWDAAHYVENTPENRKLAGKQVFKQ